MLQSRLLIGPSRGNRFFVQPSGEIMNDTAAFERVARANAASGYLKASSVEIVSAEPGAVTLKVAKKPELLQFNGFFHGGVIAGLADHAAGAAVTTSLPADRIGVTVDLHVSYLRPASGDCLVARARAVSVGQTICVAQVEVFTPAENGEERLCAIATCNLRSVYFG
jgi:uncharacterized protein (TIGR00369 family)